jgi:hypothetical protein
MGDESIRVLGSALLYCTQCEEVTECLAIPPELLRHPTTLRKYPRDYPGTHWCQRVRMCLKCKHKFMTAEVHEEKLVNLVSLAALVNYFKEAVPLENP